MQRNLIILFGTLAIGVLFLLCLRTATPRIEADLTTRSTAALASAGLPGLQVVMSGRDASLTGVVQDRQAGVRAAEIVSAVRGVRIVQDQLVVEGAANEPTAAVAPSEAASKEAAAGSLPARSQRIVLRWSGDQLTLRGEVPSGSARAAMVTNASSVFGAGRVRDELTVAAGTSDLASQRVAAVAEELARLNEGVATIVDGTVEMRGQAESAVARDAVLAAVDSWRRDGFGATEISIDLRETPPAAAAVTDALDAAGCQQELNQLLAGERIRFAKNSADIESSSVGLLDRLTAVAQRCPETRIEISGHTDSYGPADWNTELSQLRADSVAGYLIRAGVSGRRLQAKGYGSEHPIADNETQRGREQNRRIEFNILGEAGR